MVDISGGAWWALLEVDGGHYHCLRFALSCDDFAPANLLPLQPAWPFGKVLYMKFTNNGYKIRYFRPFYNLEGQECAFVWHSIGATRFSVRQAHQVNPVRLFFSCPEQLNRWPCHWLTNSGYFTDWHTKSDPRDLWPLRHLIRVMRRQDITTKKTMTKTNTNTKTMTKTNTFREHLQRAILETYDIWDIWLEWWGDMNWPKKRQWQRQIQRQRQWQRQIHSESTFKERS